MLEKWYVWDGVSGYGAAKFLMKDGTIRTFNNVISQIRETHTYDVFDRISAYTLGEKVESKRGVM